MSLEHKTILITGATSGIGFAAAQQLAAVDHTVVIVGRNPVKCIAAADSIARKTGRRVSWLPADLSSQAQVRQLAAEYRRRFPRLDVLINNAGSISLRRLETVDGLEMSWASNYLQAFLLTELLLDLLKASAPARILNMSSFFHWAGRMHLDNMQERGLYIGWNVYARCKLASISFTYELARRLAGSAVTANAMDPGLVRTAIGVNRGLLLQSIFRLVDLFAGTPDNAAAGVAQLAVDPALQAVSGQYFRGTTPVRSSPASYDRQVGMRLWEISEWMTGI